MVAGITAGGDHGAVAAAVHGGSDTERERGKARGPRRCVGSPGSSCQGRRSKGRSAGDEMVRGGSAGGGGEMAAYSREGASRFDSAHQEGEYVGAEVRAASAQPRAAGGGGTVRRP